MATGRSGPGRRDHLPRPAPAPVAAEGVTGLSHHEVAGRAGVPLGSTTYHFGTEDEPQRVPFARFAETFRAAFEERPAAAADPAGGHPSVVDLLHRLADEERELAVLREPRTLARRDPAHRPLTEQWTRRGTRVLERHFDPLGRPPTPRRRPGAGRRPAPRHHAGPPRLHRHRRPSRRPDHRRTADRPTAPA